MNTYKKMSLVDTIDEIHGKVATHFATQKMVNTNIMMKKIKIQFVVQLACIDAVVGI